MSTNQSKTKSRRTLSLAGIGCLIVAGVLTTLINQADATPTAVEVLPVPLQLSPEETMPEALASGAPQRTRVTEEPLLEEETTEPELVSTQERLSYSYSITHREDVEGPLVLETAGTLSLLLHPTTKRERLAEARLLSVVAWQSEGIDTVFLAEVMASTAVVTLSPAGAIREIELPESLSPEAERYWKCVLGRWQTAGPARPKFSKRWRVHELNELGTYSALYEPDAERGDGTIRKIIVGYKSLDDVRSPGLPMSEGEVLISPGDHPSSIEGREILRVGLGGIGFEKRLTFSFTRTR